MASSSVSWRELEKSAPEIVRQAEQTILQRRLALVGTLRADGSPRISPVEPLIADGDLVFGVMAWSGKARDLRRDRRCVLHSAVADPDAGVPEVKLYGFVEELDAALASDVPGGWWIDRPAGSAAVFSLRIEQAVLVEWDLDAGEVVVRRWSATEGACERRRPYP